jgi:hypothetical protein
VSWWKDEFGGVRDEIWGRRYEVKRRYVVRRRRWWYAIVRGLST